MINKPYIFGHRGAMGYCIENTLESFKRAIKIGVGIETDVRLTKDGKLVCFHDPSFKVKAERYSINRISLDDLKKIKFEDNRKVPTIEEVFKTFKSEKYDLRYSCDIGNRKAGMELIIIAREFAILEKIEITDMRMNVLSSLRKNDKDVRLIHTIPLNVKKVNNKTINFEKLRDLNINALNLKNGRNTEENFKILVDNGFKTYVWGVNRRLYMKKVLNMKYKGQSIDAVYSDFPDILLKMREQLINKN